MRTLALDTCSRRATVALADATGLVAQVANEQPSAHAERLIPMIEQLLAETGWTRTQLELIACGIGPGSFTGVRIALATAKGIALALDRPIAGVSSLAAMAAAYPARADELVVPVLDARRGEVFWAVYEADGSCRSAAAHTAQDKLAQAIAQAIPTTGASRPATVMVGEALAELRLEGWTQHRSTETDLPDAATIARIASRRALEGGVDALDGLEPIYVRPPDAQPQPSRESC